MRVGLVIPAYQTPHDVLQATVDGLRQTGRPMDIVVAWDGPDPPALDGVEVQVSAERRGKGRAIRDAWNAVDADVLVFVDADGATAPRSVLALIAAMPGLAVGNRRHAGGPAGQPFTRRLLGSFLVKLARRRVAARLDDYQCGAKAIDVASWRRIDGAWNIDGYPWDLELIHRAAQAGVPITEVPVQWDDRPGGPAGPGLILGFLRALRRLERP